MTKTFVKDLIERAVKTFAEVLGGFVVVGKLITEIDWSTALQVSSTATLGAVLLSLASFKFSGNGTASLVSDVVAADPPGRHEAP